MCLVVLPVLDFRWRELLAGSNPITPCWGCPLGYSDTTNFNQCVLPSLQVTFFMCQWDWISWVRLRTPRATWCQPMSTRRMVRTSVWSWTTSSTRHLVIWEVLVSTCRLISSHLMYTTSMDTWKDSTSIREKVSIFLSALFQLKTVLGAECGCLVNWFIFRHRNTYRSHNWLT